MTDIESPQAELGWYFPSADANDRESGIHSLLRTAQEDLGFVPNVFLAYGYRPERFSAWFSHYRQLHVPTDNLSAADREMIAVVVSSINRCTYCIVSHAAELRKQSGDPAWAERVSINWRHAGLTPKQFAICELADKLTTRPYEARAGDLRALEGHGMTMEEIWDVVELIAMYNFTNRLVMATGQMPNQEYYGADRHGSGDGSVPTAVDRG